MEKKTLILKIVVGLIFLLAAVGMGLIATGGESESPEMASAASYVVYLSVTLLSIATIAAVLSSLYSMGMNPSGLRKTIIGLLGLALFFGISYFVADGAQVLGANGEELIEGAGFARVSRWSEAGITFSLILLAIGTAFFVLDLVRSLIKS